MKAHDYSTAFLVVLICAVLAIVVLPIILLQKQTVHSDRGLITLTDEETGCQYVQSSVGGGMTIRLTAEGKPWCQRETK